MNNCIDKVVAVPTPTFDVRTTPVPIKLHTLALLIRHSDYNTCVLVALLNDVLSAPSNAEKEYVLSIVNSPCVTKFTFSLTSSKWEVADV